MAGVNKVILIGHVGRDAEVRFTNNGQSVANFSLATSETWGEGDNKQEKTEWHNIVVWAKQAEIAGKYVTKGRQLYVEGRLQTRDWEKDGQKHYKTEIVASRFQLLGKRDDAPDAPPDHDGDWAREQERLKQTATEEDYDLGDLSPEPTLDEPLSPGG